MAGFDLVLEVSNTTLLRSIKRYVQFNDLSINPPFETIVPLPAISDDVYIHLIVDDLLLDLNTDDTLTLTFVFTNMSITRSEVLVGGLDGNIRITAPLQLVDSGPRQKVLEIDFSTATIEINFSPDASVAIEEELSITVELLRSTAVEMLQLLVRTVSSPTLGTFTVVSGVRGSLSPLQFERLEVHCIAHEYRDKQALVLFGILDPDNPGGNYRDKTETAITAGNNICICLSSSAFHSIVFCPEIATELGAEVTQLPASCGSAEGFSYNDVTITNLSDTFADGHINIDGSMKKSGIGYKATGSFHTKLTLSVTDTTITPILTEPKIDIDVDLEWWVWLIGGVIAGPLGILITDIVNRVIEEVVEDIGMSAVNEVLGMGTPGLGFSGIMDASFHEVSITTEGLTINGRVSIEVPVPVSRDLMLDGFMRLSEEMVLLEGTFAVDVPCLRGVYSYTEYGYRQIGRYTVTPILLGRPLNLEWWIVSDSERVALSGSGGTAQIRVHAYWGVPPPAGTSDWVTAHIDYSMSGKTIELRNEPEEGNYSIDLHVRATDPVGNVEEAAIDLSIEGEQVVMSSEYYQRMQECGEIGSGPFPTGPPPEYAPDFIPPWREKLIIADFVAAWKREDPRRDESLAYKKLAYGSSFYRALFSHRKTKVGLTRKQR
jgi:hypothetical protein